ncbi:hypothetical protein C8F01DRAFT_1360460 [Mycena amicta]|nr:hypothetical protein C8F01DRAFT_1360460 [Mycena amicta]
MTAILGQRHHDWIYDWTAFASHRQQRTHSRWKMPSDEPPVLPQELIDLILDVVPDNTTLKACCLVAREFRYTSQKRLFASLTLIPSFRFWRKPHLTVAKLANVLAESPHLATHVHRVKLFSDSGNASPAWMRDDQCAGMLYRFVNLTTLAVEAHVSRLFWSNFPGPLKAALCAATALPTLTGLSLRHIQFNSTSGLLELIQGRSALRQLSLCQVLIPRLDSLGPPDERLQLESLELGAFLQPLLMCITIQINPETLRYLRITFVGPDYETMAQAHLLNRATNLEHLVITLSHDHTGESFIDLSHLLHLETLELHFELALMYKDSGYNPSNWAQSLLSRPFSTGTAGATRPPPLRHLIIEIFVDESDITHIGIDGSSLTSSLTPLSPLLGSWAEALAEGSQSPPRLTVRLDSEFDFSVSGAGVEDDIFRAVGQCGARVEVLLLGTH